MKWHGMLVVVAALISAHGAIAEHKKTETTTRSFSGGPALANSRKVDGLSKPEAIDLRAQASIEEAQKEAEVKKSQKRKVSRSFSGGNGLASTRVTTKSNKL